MLVLYLNVRQRKDTVIIATFPEVPIVVNLLPEDDDITLLKTQIATRTNIIFTQ